MDCLLACPCLYKMFARRKYHQLRNALCVISIDCFGTKITSLIPYTGMYVYRDVHYMQLLTVVVFIRYTCVSANGLGTKDVLWYSLFVLVEYTRLPTAHVDVAVCHSGDTPRAQWPPRQTDSGVA